MLACDIQLPPDHRRRERHQLRRGLVEVEARIDGLAVDLRLKILQHLAQSVRVQHQRSSAVSVSCTFWTINELRHHGHVVDPRPGIAGLRIWDLERQRLAQDLAGGLCLRRGIHDGGRKSLDDQGYLPIAEGLQQRADVDQCGIHVELSSGLPGARLTFAPFSCRLASITG